MPEHFNPLRDKMLYGGPRCAGEIRFYELRLLAYVPALVKFFLPHTRKSPPFGGLFLVCADTWSIFSLKCFAFQTIRPVLPPCVSLFSKLKRSGVRQRAARLRYRGTVAGWKAVASPQCRILPNKARWGKDGGPGGKGTPLRASQGGSLPPNS